MSTYTTAKKVVLFLIVSLVIVALNYSNNHFSSSNIPYQTALAIPNLQANNTIKPTNQPQPSNNTVTNAGITLEADKSVYVAGESVTVNGKVDEVIEGEKR